MVDLFQLDENKLFRRKRKRKSYDYYYNRKRIGYVYYIKPLIVNGIMVYGKSWDCGALEFEIYHEYDFDLTRDEAEIILLNQFEKDINSKLKYLTDMKIIKESDIASTTTP